MTLSRLYSVSKRPKRRHMLRLPLPLLPHRKLPPAKEGRATGKEIGKVTAKEVPVKEGSVRKSGRITGNGQKYCLPCKASIKNITRSLSRMARQPFLPPGTEIRGVATATLSTRQPERSRKSSYIKTCPTPARYGVGSILYMPEPGGV